MNSCETRKLLLDFWLATTTEIKAQAKSIIAKSQDLLTVSAGGNDVGFSSVLKNCVYLPSSESACQAAIDAASLLIKNNLQSNIESLLDEVILAMKDNAVVVYTLYARFFNDTSTGCNDKSWVLFDPTGRNGENFGLKLTMERRQKMNEMVQAANSRIQAAISGKQKFFESRQISMVVADWDTYVGKIKGRFCEDGATPNPDDNRNLVFQRQDQTPRFIPPERLLQADVSRRGPESDNQTWGLTTRSLLPDDITRVFHPNPLGQSIIAQLSLSRIASARATKLGSDKDAGSCILYPEPPTCKEDTQTVIIHPKFDGAVYDFCRNKSDFAVTPFDSDKSLELRFSPIAGSSCDPSDCTQSMNNLYDQCLYKYPHHLENRQVDNLFKAQMIMVPTGESLIGGEGSFSSKCGVYSFKTTDSTRQFPPGPDAVNSDGAIIKPVCFTSATQFVPQSDLDAAVRDYCANDGKAFFKGDKKIEHKISAGPETHIYTEGTDISEQTITYYKHDEVCR
ncbi:MAG: hypothetical protein Q9209_003625 [Squamulea sp. 1 TL-2023]